MRIAGQAGLVVAVWCALTTVAAANDSSAELATGGLVLVRNDDIEMRAEDLYVSAEEVRVHYRFFNTSPRDVTLRVAFPMPDITVAHQDENISIPTESPDNFLQFSTTVNGRPVASEIEQRVFARGQEQTRFLKELAIPLAPHLAATNAALDRLRPAERTEVLRRGLGEIEEFDAGKGMEKHLAARWTLKTTYHWQQVFAAGVETVIEHRYRPSVGASVQTSIGGPVIRDDTYTAAMMKKYCIDRDFVSAVAKARQQAKSAYGAPFSEQRIDYILETGGNWAGPIGEFRVVIDKGETTSLVSFCGEGVRKIGPTQFEMRKTNFTPKGNLAVLILKRLPAR